MYASRLRGLLEGQSFIDPLGNLDLDLIIGNLAKIRYKNYFSQTKNALILFCEYQNVSLTAEKLTMQSLEKMTIKKRRKLPQRNFKEIKQKINNLKSKKLKLSYQTLIATGLRVAELSQITKDNCNLSDNEIIFNFVAKGGKSQSTTIEKAEYPTLYDCLLKTIFKLNKAENIFASSDYLQKEANKLGFCCHDLRRACAKLEYKKTKSKKAVKEKLGHTSAKTTRIYLRSKINV
jgi:integrase